MDQQLPSPGEPPKPDDERPSWIPAWMTEKERVAAIIALGLVAAALVIVCGGCCSGIFQHMFRVNFNG